jgi:hypothetical protein
MPAMMTLCGECEEKRQGRTIVCVSEHAAGGVDNGKDRVLSGESWTERHARTAEQSRDKTARMHGRKHTRKR